MTKEIHSFINVTQSESFILVTIWNASKWNFSISHHHSSSPLSLLSLVLPLSPSQSLLTLRLIHSLLPTPLLSVVFGAAPPHRILLRHTALTNLRETIQRNFKVNSSISYFRFRWLLLYLFVFVYIFSFLYIICMTLVLASTFFPYVLFRNMN